MPKGTEDIDHTIDLKRMLLVRLPRLAADGSPYTASRCHHGIVMDSARFNGATRLKDPG